MKKLFLLLVKRGLGILLAILIVSCNDDTRTVEMNYRDVFAKSNISDASIIYKSETDLTRSDSEYDYNTYWKIDENGNHSEIKIVTSYGVENVLEIQYIDKLSDRFFMYAIPGQHINPIIGYDGDVEIVTNTTWINAMILIVDKQTNSVYQTSWGEKLDYEMSGGDPVYYYNKDVVKYTDRYGNIYFHSYWFKQNHIVWKFDVNKFTLEEYSIEIDTGNHIYPDFSFGVSDNAFCLYYLPHGGGKPTLRYPNGQHHELGIGLSHIFKYNEYIYYQSGGGKITMIDDGGSSVPEFIDVIPNANSIKDSYLNRTNNRLVLIYNGGSIDEFDGNQLYETNGQIGGEKLYYGDDYLFGVTSSTKHISILNLNDYSSVDVTLSNYRIDGVSVSGNSLIFSGLDYMNNGKPVIGTIDSSGNVSIVSNMEGSPSKITNLIKLN